MKAYSLDLRERLVRAVQSGLTKTEVARLFEVSLSTVKRLFKRFTQTQLLTPSPRSGRRPLISSTDYDLLGQQLRQAPDAGLAYHCQQWQHQRAVKVSRATLCRTLVRMKWSRKKKSLSAIERDEAKREAFRQGQLKLEADKLVIIDESATNLAMTSLYAYAPLGERAYGKIPRNYGQNMTLLTALTLEGIVLEASLVLEGATDRTAFEVYIQELLCPSLRPGQIVVLDNLSAHQSEEVKRAVEERGCELLFLPPYSPDFSPIELAFSKIKAHLRHLEARTKEALIEAIETALEAITPEDAQGWFKHCGYRLAVQ